MFAQRTYPSSGHQTRGLPTHHCNGNSTRRASAVEIGAQVSNSGSKGLQLGKWRRDGQSITVPKLAVAALLERADNYNGTLWPKGH